VTEIYDFLRLLYARAGTAYSYVSGLPMRRQSDDEIIDGILGLGEGSRVMILAPVVRGRKGHYRELFEQIARQGFERVRVDREVGQIAKGMKLDRYKTHDIEVVVDRIVVKRDARPRIAQSVESALGMGGGTLIASVVNGDEFDGDRLFSRHLFSAEDGISYDDPSPNTFSFNSPYGACPRCNGLGTRKEVSTEMVVPDRSLTIREGAIAPLGKPRDVWIFSQLTAVAERYTFDFETPLRDLSDRQLEVILEGAGDEQFDIVYRYKDREVKYKHRFNGVFGHLWHTYDQTSSQTSRKWAESFMRELACPECGGGRLKKESLSFRVAGKTINELVEMDLRSLRRWFEELELEDRQAIIARPIVKEISERLDFLLNVGVGYLNLDRSARSLSGGESQRIRLATQIGTQLVGVLYVLDEPSIGLHPVDNSKLIDSLKQLRDLGNSVLVVEHDREMIEVADHVIDLGPGAGEQGGHVMGTSTPSRLPLRRNGAISLTAAYLKGRRGIGLPARRRKGNGRRLELRGATGHNLKGDAVSIPLGTFVAVTGVSGSGKSSLINQTLYPVLSNLYHRSQEPYLPYDSIDGTEHIDKVIDIDQSPIGRTPRSNPATYTGLFTNIRDLFALLPESQIRGYKPGRFSFNVKGGRCETCHGAGIIKLEMNFLPDVYVECETCKGKRYNAETLEVRHKGCSIADVLDMTVDEALELFKNVPRIERRLKTLEAVGLSYIRLGQQATTLSGGEAQRVKLARELSRPGTGSTLYILDEPTTGLHFEDIRNLLNVLHALVDKGNTVVVIEHNMDVVKVADYIVDLGPDGGDAGGHVIFTGTPEELARLSSATGRVLKKELQRSRIVDDADQLEISLEDLQVDDDDVDEDEVLEEEGRDQDEFVA
jgi:excinuclease ABC subunit A